MSCMASKEYRILDRNWAPETRPPKRGKGSPLGPGLVNGVSVSPMADEKIFMIWALVAKSPISVGISGEMFWRSVSEKVIDSLHMSLHSMERA